MFRARILVIDDDALFRSLIVSILRKDFFVSVAGEGSEGYYKAIEHPPHLAVVDVQMPGWDGLRTLKAFRSHPQLSQIPIVMLTVDASKETVLAAIRGGATDYVIKTSFAKDDFLKKVEKWLHPAEMANIIGPVKAPSATAPVPPAAAGSTGSHVPDRNLQPIGDEQAMLDAWE